MIPLHRILQFTVARLLLCLSVGGAGQVYAESADTMKFRVWLGDREIGHHSFTVSRLGEQTRVLSQAFYNVKVLFVSVFKYQHEAREVWHGNCLDNIESFTKENGTESKLKAHKSDEGFIVQRNEETTIEANSCVGTYAYWDMQRIQRDVLMNAQTGDLDGAIVRTDGAQPMPRLKSTAATYRIDTDDSAIRLWYSDEGHWLALQAEADGKPLVYLNETLFR